VTHAAPDIDPDGFPLFPPLAGGREVPITARSLPRVVAGLTTGLLTARSEDVVAEVVFVEGQPVDGLALRSGRRVTGPDALDEIADVPVERVSFRELPPDLAGVLGSYFLPTELRDVPVARVVPDAFVRSLARPDARGCVLVRAGPEIGLVFLAAGEVAVALRPDAGRIGGLEEVAELLANPEARLWARLGTLPEGLAQPSPLAGEGRVGAERISTTDARARPPAKEPALIGPLPESTREPPSEPSFPRPGPPPRPVLAPADRALEQILEGIRQRLGRHSAKVEHLFLEAPQTDEGLRSAAEAVRGLRIRLVSPATLDGIADDAMAILGQEAGP